MQTHSQLWSELGHWLTATNSAQHDNSVDIIRTQEISTITLPLYVCNVICSKIPGINMAPYVSYSVSRLPHEYVAQISLCVILQ